MRRPIGAASLIGAVAALALTACAPDESDVYTVDAPVETRAPLPQIAGDLDQATAADGSTASATGDQTDDQTNVQTDDQTDDEAAPETVPPNGEVVEVRSLDNTFRAATVEIEAGTEILWINGGRNEHNVLPTDDVAAAVADFGVERGAFTPGDEYAHVFDTPGVYPYYCSIHGTQDAGMIGTIIVTAPG